MSAAPASTVPVAPRAASGSSLVEQTTALLLPAHDTLWHEVYHVVAQLPNVGDAQLWRANRTDTAEEVVLRVAPNANGDARSAASARLATIELPNLQRIYESHIVGNHRVEVCGAIRGLPLDAWRSRRASVDLATIEAVVRQLAEALGVLHASGLVHLGLRPGVVFLREEKDGLHCMLGGLETVAVYESAKPLPAMADPFYAPPEAATLKWHEPGPTLCAWDWWSLGRVVQELILGHHVLDELPGADPGQTPAMRSARADALLLEHDATTHRAGGVEVMTGLEPRLNLLLRGLLTSAVEARWSGNLVDLWLRQKPVKEYYTGPRTEQKFRWHGRVHSVAGAAKELRTAEGWKEAAAQILEVRTPGTLAHFICTSSEDEILRQSFAELLKLADSEPWRSLPPPVAREITLTVALLLLAGSNLTWRGQRIDGDGLRGILAEDADNSERLAFVRALTHRTVTAQIERHDYAASRSLAEIGRCAADAEAMVRKHGWLSGTDDIAGTQIFRLALESSPALLAVRERLQHAFACSSQPAVEKFFNGAKPTRAELVALAWVEPSAARCGFVTHADWETKQLQRLQERGAKVVVPLFWARLGGALAPGPALFGPWPAFVSCWVAAALVVAVACPGPRWLAVALAPVALAVIGRALVSLRAAAAARRFAPGSRPWRWADGATRCAAEMRAAGIGHEVDALERALGEVNAEVAKLKRLTPPPASVAAPPRFAAVRSVAIGSWFLLAAVVAVCVWRCKDQPPTLAALQAAWFSPVSVRAAAPATGVELAAPGKQIATAAPAAGTEPASPIPVATGMAAAGGDVAAGAIKVTWPFKPGDEAQVLAVTETLEATGAQISAATRRGRALVAPYRLETINSPIVFEMPMGDKIGVVLFDGVRGTLINPRIYILAYRPFARSWIEVAGRQGIFIGE